MFVMDFVQILVFGFLSSRVCVYVRATLETREKESTWDAPLCGRAHMREVQNGGCCALRSATVFCCTDCIFFAMFYIFKN